MSSKPASSPEIFQSQEAAFVEHYDWLLRWALQFTNNDRERAKDLVQQVFCQFALAHTDLSAVQNIPGYLYTTLRNTHLSEVRLTGRSHSESLSVVEYSVADVALGASDPYALVQTQDQLRQVCQYACLRKQSSRAGSVLILRFFHGYHISEIAAVLGGTCQAVRQSLRFARNEARLYLDNPGALKFISRTQRVSVPFSGTVCTADELLAELRRAIFCSCQGACLDSDSLKLLYAECHIVATDNSTLAHIVSCAKCLDAINRTLGLPLLAERHPADALGPNNNWRGGPGSSGTSGLRDDSLQSRRRTRNQNQEISSSILLQCRRRATELFEHYPRELCVSVNGHLLGSQCVNSEISRLRLDITIPEALSFIEILSEEKARLLMMPVHEPPSGEPTQTKHVVLSEGRYIEVTLRYGHPWPMLEVVYQDPNFTTESVISVSDADGMWGLNEAKDVSTTPVKLETVACLDQLPASRLEGKGTLIPPSLFRGFTQAVSETLTYVWRSISLIGRPLWSRPSTITAIVSMFVIGLLLYVRLSIAPTVSAANLIERASAAEQTLNGVRDRAIHRVINLEEYAHAGGALIARSRIEIWRDAGKDLNARRVYDDQGRLIAGEWASNHSTKDGLASRKIYRRGVAPQIEPSNRNPQAAIRNLDLWQLEPSARDYSKIIGRMDTVRVSEDSSVYIVSCAAGRQTGTDSTLLRATLVLRKSDLHAVEQTLTLRRGGDEPREYRLVEASFEQPPVHAVAPTMFEVDPELVSTETKAESGGTTPESNALNRSAVNANAAVVATPELEIEVAYLLDRFRAVLGDQINLTRTPEGLLRVEGVVDTDQRKQEVLRALSPVTRHPAVKIQIRTVAEALARQQGRLSDPGITREFSGSDNAIPTYGELYRYFSQARDAGQTDNASAKDDRIAQKVRSLAARVVGRSRRVMSHAIELKQLKERFSVSQLKVLTPNSRAKLFGMLSEHAESLRREASLLEQELAPIFFSKTYDADIGGIEISTATDLDTAIERLYKAAIASDEVIRSAFTASSDASSTALVNGPRFHQSLVTAENLAGKIREAAISFRVASR